MYICVDIIFQAVRSMAKVHHGGCRIVHQGLPLLKGIRKFLEKSSACGLRTTKDLVHWHAKLLRVKHGKAMNI